MTAHLVVLVIVLIAAVFPVSVVWNVGRVVVETLRTRVTATRHAAAELVAGCEAMLTDVADWQ